MHAQALTHMMYPGSTLPSSQPSQKARILGVSSKTILPRPSHDADATLPPRAPRARRRSHAPVSSDPTRRDTLRQSASHSLPDSAVNGRLWLTTTRACERRVCMSGVDREMHDEGKHATTIAQTEPFMSWTLHEAIAIALTHVVVYRDAMR